MKNDVSAAVPPGLTKPTPTKLLPALMVVLANIAVDIAYRVIDPRVRIG